MNIKIKKFLSINQCLCLLFIGIGMITCALTRRENPWDFINYHYYNPFALLHNRINYDIAPASVNTFFNPLGDLPLYFLIKYFNNYPTLIFSLQGIWFGLLLFAFFKCCTLFFDQKTHIGLFQIVFTCLIAATGAPVFNQAGTSTNDIPIAFFTFSSLYFLIKSIKIPTIQTGKLFLCCGFILGAAMGLKATAVYLCLASGISLIICSPYLKKTIKYIGLFTLGGILGYLALNGWWMYRLWDLYQNPVFPFANKIFQSPYFDNYNYSDRRFILPMPRCFLFPYLLWKGIQAEGELWDLRPPIYYSLFIITVIYGLLHTKKIASFYQEKKIWFFLFCFTVISYFLWLFIFSIYRYIIVTEMCCSIFLVALISKKIPKTNIKLIFYFVPITIICGIMIKSPFSEPWSVMIHQDEKYVELEQIKLPPNTLLKLYSFPIAAVIPILAQKYQFQTTTHQQIFDPKSILNGSGFTERGAFREMRDKIEKNHKGNTIIIGALRILKKNERESLDLQKDISDKYCRCLKTSSLFSKSFICVPNELKEQILNTEEEPSDAEDCNLNSMLQ